MQDGRDCRNCPWRCSHRCRPHQHLRCLSLTLEKLRLCVFVCWLIQIDLCAAQSSAEPRFLPGGLTESSSRTIQLSRFLSVSWESLYPSEFNVFEVPASNYQVAGEAPNMSEWFNINPSRAASYHMNHRQHMQRRKHVKRCFFSVWHCYRHLSVSFLFPFCVSTSYSLLDASGSPLFSSSLQLSILQRS